MADWFNKIKNVIMGNEDEEYMPDQGYDYEDEQEQYEDSAPNTGSVFSKIRNFSSYTSNAGSEEREQQSHRSSFGSFGGFNGNYGSSSKVVNLNANVNIQVVITAPTTMQEAAEVCEELKDRKTVIVNLEGLEKDLAQRITDFFCGASYALEGSVQPVSNRIIIVGPYGVNITGQLKEELEAASGLKLSGNAGWR